MIALASRRVDATVQMASSREGLVCELRELVGCANLVSEWQGYKWQRVENSKMRRVCSRRPSRAQQDAAGSRGGGFEVLAIEGVKTGEI